MSVEWTRIARHQRALSSASFHEVGTRAKDTILLYFTTAFEEGKKYLAVCSERQKLVLLQY
jgi:hypothetical protein